MKILVTGGAGFIASHIVDAYINDGHEVIVIDDLSTGRKEFLNRKAKFYRADIKDRSEVKKVIREVKPEIINHHAAQISVRDSVKDPINDLEINLIGLLNLLEEAKSVGVKKFIFASSGGVVYGEADKIPTPETYAPLLPQSPYGVTKLASEYYLNYYFQSFGISYLALRYSNVYGPRQNPHGEAGVVAIFTLKLLKNETPVINGDGLQTRDYVFIEDVVSVNRKAVNSAKTGSLNIGKGKETNVNEIFEGLRKITAKNVEPVYGPAKPGEQKRSCLDSSLAKRVLFWDPEVSLDQGLRKTVEYFQKYEHV